MELLIIGSSGLDGDLQKKQVLIMNSHSYSNTPLQYTANNHLHPKGVFTLHPKHKSSSRLRGTSHFVRVDIQIINSKINIQVGFLRQDFWSFLFQSPHLQSLSSV